MSQKQFSTMLSVIGEETIGIVSYLSFFSHLVRIASIYIPAAFTGNPFRVLCQTVSSRGHEISGKQIRKRNLIGFRFGVFAGFCSLL